jgi:D-alanyl-D-alanine carboxypeptidase/D-alanyl-D-alanine-endopeptidase (penicillin-binding protein 4)
MKILFLFVSIFYFTANAFAQFDFNLIESRLQMLSKDTSYRHANISLTILDVATGKKLFGKNENLPLAPASTLKTFTTASALKLLGEQFRYETKIQFQGSINNGIGEGIVKIYACGDPSFGSDRFEETKPELIKQKIAEGLRKLGIEKIKGSVQIINNIFSDEGINTGWLAEDIGNYYGAGIYALNWKENKFELNLVPTTTSFEVSSTNAGYDIKKDFCIELKHKEGATTEEAFAFVEKDKTCKYVIRGVLSNTEKVHNMQLARLYPDQDFQKELTEYLQKEFKLEPSSKQIEAKEISVVSHFSPTLKQLVYWCNQKSLNLYAEAFCKTMSLKSKQDTPYLFPRTLVKGNWLAGLNAMISYAKSLNINMNSVKLLDASGLAPENRITTSIMAQLLHHYSKESYYPTFFESLPSINGLRMKSGYIGGTRSYAGYIKMKDSTEACFAFIINDYTCKPKEVKLSMFQILDILK